VLDVVGVGPAFGAVVDALSAPRRVAWPAAARVAGLGAVLLGIAVGGDAAFLFLVAAMLVDERAGRPLR
jgi:hypothetical protein